MILLSQKNVIASRLLLNDLNNELINRNADKIVRLSGKLGGMKKLICFRIGNVAVDVDENWVGLKLVSHLLSLFHTRNVEHGQLFEFPHFNKKNGWSIIIKKRKVAFVLLFKNVLSILPSAWARHEK